MLSLVSVLFMVLKQKKMTNKTTIACKVANERRRHKCKVFSHSPKRKWFNFDGIFITGCNWTSSASRDGSFIKIKPFSVQCLLRPYFSIDWNRAWIMFVFITLLWNNGIRCMSCYVLVFYSVVQYSITEYKPSPNVSFTVYPKKYAHGFCFAVFVVVIHWLIFPYPSGLLHWHCGNLTIAPVPAKQPWWIWINTSCEFIMNDCITTTKQSKTKPCAYFLGYTVVVIFSAPYSLDICLKDRIHVA